MKITIEATGTVDTIAGTVQARMWAGKTESGVPVQAWIAVIQPQTHDEAALKEFERELKEVAAKRSLVSCDIRMII